VPLPNPDAAVRAIAAELAALHVEDSAAILGALNERERKTIEQFLRVHIGGFQEALAVSGAAAAYDSSRLSPWLIQQLQSARQEGGTLTPTARQALLDCVAKLHPVSP